MTHSNHIAILIPSLLKGGAEKQSVFLANELSENNKVYLVILNDTWVDPSIYNVIDLRRVKVIFIKKGILNNIIQVYKLFKNEKINTVFSYLASANFINGFVGRLAKVQNRVGGIRNAQLSKKKLPFEKFFHNRLLSISISNSHSAVFELTQRGFDKNKFKVIHNAFNLTEKPIVRIENKNVNIVSLARFVSQKDYFTAIKSIELLLDLLSDYDFNVKYFIVGYGVLEQEIRNEIKRLHLDKFVEISINPKNVSDYYKLADIFLTTSLYEGMSNSVMEAMSFSLPIVTTKAGDAKFLVKNNINGYICPFKDSKVISEKLFEVVTNFNLRIHMGRNSYTLLKNNFSLQKFNKSYEDVLNSF